MNRVFTITAASERVPVGGDGRGETTFTVTNSSARPLRGQLRVRPLGSTKGEWLSIVGETERPFSPNAAQQVVVKVATPSGAPAGKYQFRLDAVSVINPDDDFTEGPAVDLEVKAAEGPKKAFPWWIVAAAGGAVILIVTLTWLLWPRSIEVPDVVGLDIEEAKKKFEDLNLKIEITRQPNASVVRDRVFGQDPKGSSKAEAGATVMLLVAAQKTEPASQPAPTPMPIAANAAPPTPAPTPWVWTCGPKVFRVENQNVWVEFRLPQSSGPAPPVKVPAGAYSKSLTPAACSRIWWDENTFSCVSRGAWERLQGNTGADTFCGSAPGTSPYVATGNK